VLKKKFNVSCFCEISHIKHYTYTSNTICNTSNTYNNLLMLILYYYIIMFLKDKKNLYDPDVSSSHKSIDPAPFNVDGLVGNLTCDTVVVSRYD